MTKYLSQVACLFFRRVTLLPSTKNAPHFSALIQWFWKTSFVVLANQLQQYCNHDKIICLKWPVYFSEGGQCCHLLMWFSFFVVLANQLQPSWLIEWTDGGTSTIFWPAHCFSRVMVLLLWFLKTSCNKLVNQLQPLKLTGGKDIIFPWPHHKIPWPL